MSAAAEAAIEPTLIADIAELSHDGFVRLATYVTRELGIKMPDSKLTMVQSRLMRRTRELGLRSVDAYVESLFSTPDHPELEQLVNAITTNKTDFFREPEHFAFLVDEVLRERAAKPERARERFAVWSAGCSSGEEAYTLAMVLNEHARANSGFDYAILATDISTRVLAQARDAVYRSALVDPVAPELRRRYLLQNADRSQVRVAAELRRRVSFHQLNFMTSSYPVKPMFDAIFFRNVMIYFDRPTQNAVIGRLCRHLAPGGYLFIGHSESLSGLALPLEPVRVAVYRKTNRT